MRISDWSSDVCSSDLADYYLGGTLAVSRQEATINYQFIRDQKNWPEAAKATTKASADIGQNTAGVATQHQKVVWSGDSTAGTSGVHKFRLYASSYLKLYADSRLVLGRRRKKWHPGVHTVELEVHDGKPVA